MTQATTAMANDTTEGKQSALSHGSGCRKINWAACAATISFLMLAVGCGHVALSTFFPRPHPLFSSCDTTTTTITVTFVLASCCFFALAALVVAYKSLSQKAAIHFDRLWSATGCLLLCATLGVFGLVVSFMDDGCQDSDNAEAKENARLLSMMSTSLSVLLLALAGLLLVQVANILIYQRSADGESSKVLVCLRCSCVSSVTKRVLLLAPFVVLLAVNLFLFVSNRDATCEDAPLVTYVGASSILILLVTLAVVTFIVVSSRMQPRVLRASAARHVCNDTGEFTDNGDPSESSEQKRTMARRRRRQRGVMVMILVFGLVSITWAVCGWVWITEANKHPGSCSNTIVMAATGSSVQQFVVGCVLVVTTICCRVEQWVFDLGRTTEFYDATLEATRTEQRVLSPLEKRHQEFVASGLESC